MVVIIEPAVYSWQVLPVSPPAPNGDQLPCKKSTVCGPMSTDCDAGLTVKQHLVSSKQYHVYGSCGLMTTNNYLNV